MRSADGMQKSQLLILKDGMHEVTIGMVTANVYSRSKVSRDAKDRPMVWQRG